MRGKKTGEAFTLAVILCISMMLCVPYLSDAVRVAPSEHCLHQVSGASPIRIIPTFEADAQSEEPSRRLDGARSPFRDLCETALRSSLVAALLLIAVAVWLRLIDLCAQQIVCRGGIHAPPMA